MRFKMGASRRQVKALILVRANNRKLKEFCLNEKTILSTLMMFNAKSGKIYRNSKDDKARIIRLVAKEIFLEANFILKKRSLL